MNRFIRPYRRRIQQPIMGVNVFFEFSNGLKQQINNSIKQLEPHQSHLTTAPSSSFHHNNYQITNDLKQQRANTISLIMREIEAKKQLIRKVRNDQKEVKKHLIELVKNIFHLIVSNFYLDRANFNLELKTSISNLTDLNK